MKKLLLIACLRTIVTQSMSPALLRTLRKITPASRQLLRRNFSWKDVGMIHSTIARETRVELILKALRTPYPSVFNLNVIVDGDPGTAQSRHLKSGNTLLHVAAAQGHVKGATALIPHSDVNALNNAGKTPLMEAMQNMPKDPNNRSSTIEIICRLTGAGANPYITNTNGDSAYIMLAELLLKKD